MVPWSFNKILENALTKIYNSQRNDWDLRVNVVLWAYRTTCKKLTGHMPFSLVYRQEAVMPMEYILPSLRIAQITGMTDIDMVHERLAQLLALEEDRFIAGFHQKVQKAQEKSWHDRHVKNKIFQIGDLVLLYNSKFVKFPGKFKTHWLGPYQIQQVTKGGAVQLNKLNEDLLPTFINGTRLKLYNASHSIPQP